MPSPSQGYIPGNKAEDFEVRSYSFSYETYDKDNLCTELSDLKSQEDVIFTRANTYERGCSYGFKVVKDSAEEVLSVLEDLDPKDISESIQTIQKAVSNTQSEIDILNEKRVSIEKNLEEAIVAYDELSDLAKNKEDIESLTKLIDLKMNTINRLTEEKLNLNERIARYQKSQEEQLDRLKYVEFNVSVSEVLLIDWQQLSDSWRYTVQSFFRDINMIIQDVTLNLVTWVMRAVQAFIYIGFALVFIKLLWVFARKVVFKKQEGK